MTCSKEGEELSANAGLGDNEIELIDKVLTLDNDDSSYLSLVAECLAEISQSQLQDNCLVEINNENSTVLKYYSDDTAVEAVQRHFTRSLQENSRNLNKTTMNEIESPAKQTARGGKKAKRKTKVTTLTPKHAPVATFARQVHPYARMTPASVPHSSAAFAFPTLRPRCAMAYYASPTPQQYCLQHYHHPTNYNTKIECPRQNTNQQPVYKVIARGNTLIEVYSPTVGNGFNPRYNSQLIEPTIQAFLPRMTGQPADTIGTVAEMHTFQNMAVEFTLPKML